MAYAKFITINKNAGHETFTFDRGEVNGSLLDTHTDHATLSAPTGQGFAEKGRISMIRYKLFVKLGQVWTHVRTIEAPTDQEALRQAISGLPAAHYGKPIKLEPDRPDQPAKDSVVDD